MGGVGARRRKGEDKRRVFLPADELLCKCLWLLTCKALMISITASQGALTMCCGLSYTWRADYHIRVSQVAMFPGLLSRQRCNDRCATRLFFPSFFYPLGLFPCFLLRSVLCLSLCLIKSLSLSLLFLCFLSLSRSISLYSIDLSISLPPLYLFHSFPFGCSVCH